MTAFCSFSSIAFPCSCSCSCSSWIAFVWKISFVCSLNLSDSLKGDVNAQQVLEVDQELDCGALGQALQPQALAQKTPPSPPRRPRFWASSSPSPPYPPSPPSPRPPASPLSRSPLSRSPLSRSPLSRSPPGAPPGARRHGARRHGARRHGASPTHLPHSGRAASSTPAQAPHRHSAGRIHLVNKGHPDRSQAHHQLKMELLKMELPMALNKWRRSWNAACTPSMLWVTGSNRSNKASHQRWSCTKSWVHRMQAHGTRWYYTGNWSWWRKRKHG